MQRLAVWPRLWHLKHLRGGGACALTLKLIYPTITIPRRTSSLHSSNTDLLSMFSLLLNVCSHLIPVVLLFWAWFSVLSVSPRGIPDISLLLSSIIVLYTIAFLHTVLFKSFSSLLFCSALLHLTNKLPFCNTLVISVFPNAYLSPFIRANGLTDNISLTTSNLRMTLNYSIINF